MYACRFYWGSCQEKKHRAGAVLFSLPPLKYFIGHTFLQNRH